MSTAISFSENVKSGVSLDTLMVELDHYRRQSEWLSCLNELHARLAGVTDVTSMIEAFSVWLMPLVEHDLIAYQSDDRRRLHILCSCHGPERRRVRRVAQKIFQKLSGKKDNACWLEEDCHVRNWHLNSRDSHGHLIILRHASAIDDRNSLIVDNVLQVLGESLERAMDYEELFEMARRDSLTGLDNRRVFEERVGPLLESAKRHNHPVTLACMDLDRFKQLNDTHGHAAGDRALREVAQAIQRTIRGSDLFVRMGGDEFVLVLPNTSLPAAQFLAERLCRAVDHLDIRTSASARLGVSIGLVQWEKGMTKEEWLQRADEALYEAKSTGRSKVCAG